MNTTNKKFITTTLPYANSKPHIGHAFEFIIADAIARYYRNKFGDDRVLFNVGLDEHGKKIFDSAFREGVLPLDFLDKLEIVWREFCHKFEISFDNFYRTSDYPHYSKTQRVWVELKKRGFIYQKQYTDKYCDGCESFKLEKDLVDGKCQDHPNLDVYDVSEINYFFRLSAFKEELKALFENNRGILTPNNKRTEVLNFIENIRDISISRDRKVVQWGIPVPGDNTQTIYVWFDALLNYIFSAGFLSKNFSFEQNWNDAVQVFGVDNLKFQAVIFQGILLALDIKNTSYLLCHGTILDGNGRKMSKTVGNVIDPIDQLDKYGLDAVKYYALVGGNIYDSLTWDENSLVELYNSHLADDYGNLISRVVTLIGRGLKENEVVDDPNIVLNHSLVESNSIILLIKEQIVEIKDLWDSHRITEALIETNKLVKWCNKYINEEQPWKKDGDWWVTLLELHYILTFITDLYKPVFPNKSEEACKSLNELNRIVLFPKITLL